MVYTHSNESVHVFVYQSELRCRLLRPPHGMLSGIGRKVSSLIFGGGTQQQIEDMVSLSSSASPVLNKSNVTSSPFLA